MKLEKILCPVDFSPASDAALKMATSLARESGAQLIIVYVDEGPLAYNAGMAGFVDSEDHFQAADRIQEVGQEIRGVDWRQSIVRGDPAQEIVRLAEEEHADMIVMGTHGHTGLLRLLMGSVAEAVVRRAPCPVMSLRQPENVTNETE